MFTTKLSGLLLILLFSHMVVLAGDDPVNQSLFGVAVKGYDMVAYFTEGKPVKGSADFKFTWKDAEWRFASEENRDLFKNDPEKYAPQYGGYCAWAVAHNSTAGIDPKAWKIVDGKLYLNYSLKIQKQWSEDIPGYIKRADANWPAVLD